MQQAKASGVNFTADQIAHYEQQISASSTSDVMTVAGDSAEIHVKGVLTNTPDMYAMYFGGGNTTYQQIISAAAEADANNDIKEAIFRFDSGGGSIIGMFDAMAAIKQMKTPTRAIVGTMAMSAAYGLASQCNTIVAHNRASGVGSVGTAIDARLKEGVVSITSTNAPNKRPDLKTEEGKAILVEKLDAVHDLFAEGIAEGRNTTVEKVNADFGRGGEYLADEALKRGMIDGITKTAVQSVNNTKSTTASSGNKLLETKAMDLKQLQSGHPLVYAEALALGAAQGTASERDRVSAHMTMGTASGDMKTAIEAIEAGTGITDGIQAKHFAAAMNRNDVNLRQSENVGEIGAGKDLADKGADADKVASANILSAAYELCGVEMAV